jgi:hypothetical protein
MPKVFKVRGLAPAVSRRTAGVVLAGLWALSPGTARASDGASVFAPLPRSPLVALLPAALPTRASTRETGSPLGSFNGLVTIVGSLNAGTPFLPGSGLATGGYISPSGAPALLSDGSVLVPEDQVVRRVTADGWSTIVAGHPDVGCTGAECDITGDGGPATAARIRAFSLAPLPDGGFLIGDLNGRVRRVAPDGTITTVAGGGANPSYPKPDGDGWPALGAGLDQVRGLTVAPDGSFFFLDHGWIVRVGLEGRLHIVADMGVRAGGSKMADEIALQPDGGLLVLGGDTIKRVAPDGRVTRLARLGSRQFGLVALPDGGALTVSDRGGEANLTAAGREFRVLRVSPSGKVSVVVGPEVFRDYAGREPFGDPAIRGLTLGTDGLYIATATALLIAPNDPASRLTVRIRDSRTTRGRLRLRVQASRPAQVALSVHRFNYILSRPLARAQAPAAVSTQWLEVPEPRRPNGLYLIRAQVSTPDAVSADWVTLLLGPMLPRAIWRVVTGNLSETDTFHCRRMSPRRIDCADAGFINPYCDFMDAFIAGQDGVVRWGTYRCRHNRPRWVRRPHWLAPPSPTRPVP